MVKERGEAPVPRARKRFRVPLTTGFFGGSCMNTCLCGLFDQGNFWWIILIVLFLFVLCGGGYGCGSCGGGCGGGCCNR